MSRLTPGIITLDKGLDLNTAKIAAPEGTLLDMLNYEQVDFMGQKRIDGYVRYDGSLGSYQDVIYRVVFADNTEASVGDVVFNGEEIVGVATSVDDAEVIKLAVINQNLIPRVGTHLSLGTVTSITELKDELDAVDQYEAVLENNAALRDRTTALPGPVAGLHWFNDRLYAVASMVKTPNRDGYELNDMTGRGPVLGLDNDMMYVGTAVLGGSDVDSDMASLFQSRSEQQALDELGDASQHGWEFVHQGWTVPFENGTSLYGSLAALNQNRKGVGVQGPTSISGNNGRPLSVTQKVNITNLPEQINGWKTSDSRTTYNLDVNALTHVDDWTIYADAFISWEGDKASPTLGPLVEYSPSATVKIEV